MFRLLSTIQKETIILRRDKGGLAILFLMPMALIIIMALIQDGPFRDYQEMKVPLLLVNNDTGTFGKRIETGLSESGIFQVTKQSIPETTTRSVIKRGDYTIGIIIPPNATALLNEKISVFVQHKLSEAGLGDSTATLPVVSDSLNMLVYFAPETKKSFKASILSSLKQTSTLLETEIIIASFYKAMNSGSEQKEQKKSSPGIGSFVNYSEISTLDHPEEAKLMNSVQHNVPAWTMFGMFFIVISLSGSIIKEREDGSYTRIRTMPGSYLVVMTGKIAAYLMVCLVQCALMLLVGLYLLPLLGLPKLIIGDNLPALFLVALSAGLAATGYGSLVGTLFKTHQQSSTFGSVSVVILAALGGIWVPVYVMPDAIRFLAEYSPLYWGLSAFHELFLNHGGVKEILPSVIKLVLFFFACGTIAYFYNKKRENS